MADTIMLIIIIAYLLLREHVRGENSGDGI